MIADELLLHAISMHLSPSAAKIHEIDLIRGDIRSVVRIIRAGMPTYQYACPDCGLEFEKVQKFTDDPVKKCPNCSKRRVYRVVSKVAVSFKGSGWYITDSKSNNSAGSPGKDKDKDKAETGEVKTETSETKAPATESTTTESTTKEAKPDKADKSDKAEKKARKK